MHWIAIAITIAVVAVYIFGLSGMSGFTAESNLSIYRKAGLLAALLIVTALFLM